MNRWGVLVGVLLQVVVGFSQQQSTNSVETALKTFVAQKDLSGAAISFHAIDLASGATIATHNSEMAIIPASTVKLFTTATAFQRLGPYFRPETKLYYTGTISEEGVLSGNIIIKGGGDPTLGSKYFTKDGEERDFFHDWVKSIRELGITKVDGYVLADASALGYDGAPAGWTWSDMGNYYGAWPSGLTLFDNMIKLYFSTSDTAGDTSSLDCIEPYIPGLYLENRVQSASVKGDNAYVFGAPYSKDWFVEGRLPLKQEDFMVKAANPDPEELFALEFTSALKNSGIDVKYHYQTMRKNQSFRDLYYDSAELIMEYKGKDVTNIAYWVNQRSVNLFAEHLVCLIGLQRFGQGNTSNGVQAMVDYWTNKIDISTIRLTDGSGLSRSNAVSAQHFTSLLKYMNKEGAAQFEKSLPIAGKSGTLASVCRGQSGQGRIFAKSGTMSRVKSYAGYVNTKSGKKLAFAIIVNNHTNSSYSLTRKMEAIFNAMANF